MSCSFNLRLALKVRGVTWPNMPGLDSCELSQTKILERKSGQDVGAHSHLVWDSCFRGQGVYPFAPNVAFAAAFSKDSCVVRVLHCVAPVLGVTTLTLNPQPHTLNPKYFLPKSSPPQI